MKFTRVLNKNVKNILQRDSFRVGMKELFCCESMNGLIWKKFGNNMETCGKL